MTDQPDPYAPPPPGSTPPEPPPYATPPAGGTPQPPPYGVPGGYQPARQGTNGFAIASLVCAFVCSPLGIIFGFVARGQIRRTGQGGDGLALAGIILSIVFLILGIVVTMGR